MNRMVEELLSNVHFQIRQDMEFLFAVCNLTLVNDLAKAIEEKEIAADSHVMNMLEGMRKKASKYMLHELDCFFGNLTVQLAFFTYSLERGKTGTISELLENLERDDVKVLFSYMVEAFVHTSVHCGKKDFESQVVCRSMESMLSYIVSANTDDCCTRDKLVEFLSNPIETKQRYCFLVKSFYEKLYKPCEEVILSCLEKTKNKYYLNFRNDPAGFFNNYLNITPEKFQKKLEIHISCFHQSSMLILQSADINKPTWIGLSANCDLNLQHKNSILRENAQKIFKLLSDRTRFDILCLLKERPWYNQEVAERLGIAPSTINHHFAALLQVGIVVMEREEHRMYYSLKKDRLKELLGRASEFLLG